MSSTCQSFTVGSMETKAYLSPHSCDIKVYDSTYSLGTQFLVYYDMALVIMVNIKFPLYTSSVFCNRQSGLRQQSLIAI